MIAGGDVEAPITTRHGRFKQLPIRDITFNAYELSPGQAARIAAFPEQSFYRMAPRVQFMNEVGPDKAGCARDETFHAGTNQRESSREVNAENKAQEKGGLPPEGRPT